MKNCKMILTGRQPKYLYYCQIRQINMSTWQVKKYCLPQQHRKVEEAKFTYSPLGKAFEKQIKIIEDQ